MIGWMRRQRPCSLPVPVNGRADRGCVAHRLACKFPETRPRLPDTQTPRHPGLLTIQPVSQSGRWSSGPVVQCSRSARWRRWALVRALGLRRGRGRGVPGQHGAWDMGNMGRGTWDFAAWERTWDLGLGTWAAASRPVDGCWEVLRRTVRYFRYFVPRKCGCRYVCVCVCVCVCTSQRAYAQVSRSIISQCLDPRLGAADKRPDQSAPSRAQMAQMAQTGT
ncbi:hypothetical protein F4780DRAFT_710820 [Xylariomycetidae sp. FL0641]|nr:hypothetical protein F4780DRAFT_710820 [Xylariomycetidae sp. FL0641]